MAGEADSPIGASGSAVSGAQGDFPAVPYRLPSGGIHYASHGGVVMIRGTRGEEEEMLAGTQDADIPTRLATFRALTARCVDFRGVTLEELTIPDWVAIMFNFFAISSGDDRIKLTPVHANCPIRGESPGQVLPLTDLRCVRLARTEPGLPPNWPPVAKTVEEKDALMDALRAMDTPVKTGGVVTRVLAEPDYREPFTTNIATPGGPLKVQWRLLRVGDLIKAEEFAATLAESGAASTKPDGPMHTYLLAQQLVSIGGERMTPLRAATWVRRAGTPTLNALRTDIAARAEYGYDLTPKFKCGKCSATFRTRLPIDTNFFRPGDDD